MTVTRYLRGFEWPGDGEATGHPISLFQPQGSRGSDGRVHHQRTALTCSCGFAGRGAGEIHDHFLTVSRPAGFAGQDDAGHQPGSAGEFDLSLPSVARIYNVLLGGKDNLPADRNEAARLLAACPGLADLAVDSRAFLLRAVTWVAHQGVRRFVDLGCGLPVPDGGNIHEVAQAVDPGARVAYVDRDPLVLVHARALLAEGGLVVQADLRQPSAIAAHPMVRDLLGAGERAAIVLGLVLHFLSPGEARQVVQVLARAVAPGSYLIASVGVTDPETGRRIAAEYTASQGWNHSAAEVAGFFDGLDIVSPGVVLASDWAPAAAAPVPAIRGAQALAVVARTPEADTPPGERPWWESWRARWR